jgi:hypothetical protein
MGERMLAPEMVNTRPADFKNYLPTYLIWGSYWF